VANPNAIRAGRAVIVLNVKDNSARALRSAESRFRLFGSAVQGVAQEMARLSVSVFAQLAKGMLGFLVNSVKEAGDLVETMNAFRASFADQAPVMEKWAIGFADALGRTRKETLDTMAAFQSLFTGQGMDPKMAATFTKEITKASVSMGSFKNVTDKVAAQKLMSGITGEPETVRRWGADIGEKAMNAELVAQGFGTVQQGVSDLVKEVVRFIIVLRSMEKQGGTDDAITTYKDFVNQVKRLRAQFLNLKVAIGQQLIPAANQFVTALASGLKHVPEQLAEITRNFLNIEDIIGGGNIWDKFLDEVTTGGIIDRFHMMLLKMKLLFTKALKWFNRYLVRMYYLNLQRFTPDFLDDIMTKYFTLTMDPVMDPSQVEKEIKELEAATKRRADAGPQVFDPSFYQDMDAMQKLLAALRAQMDATPGGGVTKELRAVARSAGAFRAGAKTRLGQNLRGTVREITSRLDEQIGELKQMNQSMRGIGGLSS